MSRRGYEILTPCSRSVFCGCDPSKPSMPIPVRWSGGSSSIERWKSFCLDMVPSFPRMPWIGWFRLERACLAPRCRGRPSGRFGGPGSSESRTGSSVKCATWPTEDGAIRTAVEVRGEIEFEVSGAPFMLVAKADRIDTRPDGSLAIIDYKTGGTPSQKEIVSRSVPSAPSRGLDRPNGRLSRCRGRIDL